MSNRRYTPEFKDEAIRPMQNSCKNSAPLKHLLDRYFLRVRVLFDVAADQFCASRLIAASTIRRG